MAFICQVFQQNVYQLLPAAACSILPSFLGNALALLLLNQQVLYIVFPLWKMKISSPPPFSHAPIFSILGQTPVYCLSLSYVILLRAVVTGECDQVSLFIAEPRSVYIMILCTAFSFLCKNRPVLYPLLVPLPCLPLIYPHALLKSCVSSCSMFKHLMNPISSHRRHFSQSILTFNLGQCSLGLGNSRHHYNLPLPSSWKIRSPFMLDPQFPIHPVFLSLGLFFHFGEAKLLVTFWKRMHGRLIF